MCQCSLFIQCQHFRKHYIGFAKQVNELITEYEQNNHKKNDNTHRGSSLTAASTPPVQFYAISCTINRKLCQKQGIHGYPVIKLFAANATVNATGEILYWKLHAFDALDILQIRIDNADHDRTKFDAKTKQIDDQSSKSTGSAVAKKRKRTRKRKPQKQQKLNQQVLYRTKQQIFDDAHLSLIFNLRNSVFISDDENQPLSNATKIALKNWLELVAQTTPVLWPMRSTIRAILAEFDLATAKEANLLAILDRFPPPISHWSASCTKGVSGMGYTCGLWELFHIMSVGLVEYNLVIPAEDDLILRELSISPTHAAETFRNFVEYFFACDECRRNFLHAYDNCALDRCIRFNEKERDYEQWILFPVWLFETHNAVNQRLLQERTKRENHGAATKPQSVASSQWPAKTACPKCWLDSGGWDEEAVYKFLRTDYWYVTSR